MADTTLNCEQAIFTSTRTAMGEGYRIIAASKGLRPDEKQTITRNSPSHDALCAAQGRDQAKSFTEGEVVATAFYPLPSGRLCVALSCFAGAEHTGRGGQRIYTHNVVLPADALSKIAFNPYHVLRAMHAEGLATPQLKPPAILPEVQLKISKCGGPPSNSVWRAQLSSAIRRHLLINLLADRSLILNLETDWMEVAEAIILGIPGPSRSKLSVCTGMKYSVGRSHRLQLLHDATTTTKTRMAGQRIEYIEPANFNAPKVENSNWATFVDHLWERGDLATLELRTAKPFRDVSLEARERVGRWYVAMNEAPKMETARLLSSVAETLEPRNDPIEREIVAELHGVIQGVILDRLQAMSWPQISLSWAPLVQAWRRGEAGCMFAHPLVVAGLRRALRDDPAAAAAAAFQVARDVPAHAQANGHNKLLDDVLQRAAEWAQLVEAPQREPLRSVVPQWRTVRPGCPLVKKLFDALMTPLPCP